VACLIDGKNIGNWSDIERNKANCQSVLKVNAVAKYVRFPFEMKVRLEEREGVCRLEHEANFTRRW
jgi:hypothetical protein